MKQFILYLPETEAEVESLRSVQDGPIRNIVFWQDKLLELSLGNLSENPALTNLLKIGSAESSSGTEANNNGALAKELPAEVVTLEALQQLLLVQKHQNYQINTLAEFFNPKSLPADFHSTEEV